MVLAPEMMIKKMLRTTQHTRNITFGAQISLARSLFQPTEVPSQNVHCEIEGFRHEFKLTMNFYQPAYQGFLSS
jgi:hypothetical protein